MLPLIIYTTLFTACLALYPAQLPSSVDSAPFLDLPRKSVPIVSNYKYEIPHDYKVIPGETPYPAPVYGPPKKVVELKPYPAPKPTTPAPVYGPPKKVEVFKPYPASVDVKKIVPAKPVVSTYLYHIPETPAPYPAAKPTLPAPVYGPPEKVEVSKPYPAHVEVKKTVPAKPVVSTYVYHIPETPAPYPEAKPTVPAPIYGPPKKVEIYKPYPAAVEVKKIVPAKPVVSTYVYNIPETPAPYPAAKPTLPAPVYGPPERVEVSKPYPAHVEVKKTVPAKPVVSTYVYHIPETPAPYPAAKPTVPAPIYGPPKKVEIYKPYPAAVEVKKIVPAKPVVSTYVYNIPETPAPYPAAKPTVPAPIYGPPQKVEVSKPYPAPVLPKKIVPAKPVVSKYIYHIPETPAPYPAPKPTIPAPVYGPPKEVIVPKRPAHVYGPPKEIEIPASVYGVPQRFL